LLRRLSLTVLTAVLLLPSLFYPFARDQGVFAYTGSVILSGGWPYRDVWDLKPPGVYYTYAAMLGLTGSSMGGVRAVDMAAAVLTALLSYAVLSRLATASAAWLGGLLYAALYLRLGFWGMAQAESYANLWTAAALLAWLRAGESEGSTRRHGGSLDSSPTSGFGGTRPLLLSVAAGAAAAMVLLLKVTVLLPLLVTLTAVSGLRLWRDGWRAESIRITALSIGLLAPVALTAVALWRSGAGAAYLEIQQGFVAGYLKISVDGHGPGAQGWDYFWRLYSVPAAVAVVGLWVLRNSSRLVLGAWLAAAFASVSLQQKYFGYHWTPTLLPLAGLAGVGLASLLAPVRRLARGSALAVLVLGAVLIAGWSIERAANGYAATARLLTGRLRPEQYWARFGRPQRGDFSFLADVWAADCIRRQTRPGDPVYIWGFEPLTLFLAGRRAPTRFVFAVPLVSPWTPSRWRDELIRDLKARPPALFGVMRHDAIPHASGRRDDSAAQLNGFPALREFLRQGYRYETTIEDLTLYRRRPPTGRAAR
jgi:hypothetical protein